MSAQKVVIIGAGSLQFGLGTVGSIFASDHLTGSTICLHDINEENLDKARVITQSVIDEKKIDFNLEATTSRPEAIKGANFIVNSIEVTPRFKWFDMDMEIPRKYGFKHVFGENGGPGGLFHSLRVIPPILEICDDVQKICPNAWLINFSNPMSRICLAIKRKFPELKVVGLCHEIHFARLHLPKILGTPFETLHVWGGGLNHFGAIIKATYKDSGKDAIPDIREKAPEYLEKIKAQNKISYVFNTSVSLTSYILYKYGYLPYTTDSHYGEYIGWAWEEANKDGIDKFYKGYKSYIAYEGKKIDKLIKKGKGSRLVRPDAERAIPIIEGILTDSNHEELSVNLPNNDIISNLPKDLVVECPAIVNKTGVHGVKLGEYPKGIASLLRIEASVQDLVIEAILTKSKDIALQALLADPNVGSTTKAEQFLNIMLELQKEVVHLD